jgi:hypothetical protein
MSSVVLPKLKHSATNSHLSLIIQAQLTIDSGRMTGTFDFFYQIKEIKNSD